MSNRFWTASENTTENSNTSGTGHLAVAAIQPWHSAMSGETGVLKVRPTTPTKLQRPGTAGMIDRAIVVLHYCIHKTLDK